MQDLQKKLFATFLLSAPTLVKADFNEADRNLVIIVGCLMLLVFCCLYSHYRNLPPETPNRYHPLGGQSVPAIMAINNSLDAAQAISTAVPR